MAANYYGMYRRLEEYVRRAGQARCADPRETMLQMLLAPYNDPKNYDEFLEALRQLLAPEEAEVWPAYPDFAL